jgi:hypothetical protein
VRHYRRPAIVALSLALGSVGACIATSPTGIQRQTEDDSDGSDTIDVDGGAPDATFDVGDGDPHAVLGADPPHGPFNGGQRVLLHGKGFTSDVRVWFGDAEVDPSTIVPVDATRVQVNAPPGLAGPVDVAAQNGSDESTRRSLPGGYSYDQFYAVPAEGPVSGGTVIEIVGQATAWDATTAVHIDQKPCQALTLDSPTLLGCTVPPGTPGSKPIRVTTGDDTIVVLDGYNYEDSDNGYKGGLSGAPIAGKLKVLVYDNFTGAALAGAHAVVGTQLSTALIAEADGYGVAVFEDASLDGPRTVTVAAKCHSPISFVDVPVDTVTAYLDPVLLPECAGDGDPPPVGGKTATSGVISGELVWPEVQEFKKGPWSNVPAPANADEQQAAYVFVASSDPTAAFQLPPEYDAVHPTTPGDVGYQFLIAAQAGNRAIYALAGIENREVSPPKFTAYVMGMVKGLPVVPESVLEEVYVSMTKTLDQALVWDVAAPPPGPKGPDRLRGTVAIMLGNDGFAVLPAGQKTPLLPLSADLPFVGVPPLDGDLFGASYLSTARAVTGPSFTAPMSVIGRLLTQTTSQVVPVNGFIGVPTLVTPALNADWDGMHLETSFPPGPIDLSVYDIVNGNGLVRWTVVVPAGSHAIELPDISGFELAGLPAGPLTIGVYGARVEGFDYANLRYRDIRPQGMSAYSLDYFPAHL